MEMRSSRTIVAAAALPILILSCQYSALAQEAKTDGTYLSDSTQDRTPAITAFPKYPLIARRDRIEGSATVCFTINARGQIIRPSIRSSTHKIFEGPAMKAIRASTFEPLKPGESKSNIKTCRVYRFRLDPIVASNGDK